MTVQMLTVYAGYMQLRRIALRKWALVLAHQSAEAWHSDTHDNNCNIVLV